MNEQLQIKLKQDEQKNQREKLLNFLPKSILQRLSECAYITTPDKEVAYNKVLELWDYGVHNNSFAECHREYVREFSWEHQVIQFVQNITMDKNDVWLFIGGGNYPLFSVEGKWAIDNFNHFFNIIKDDALWIFSKDVKYGILVDCYTGYLEHDPNPDEIYYQVVIWGLTTNT